MALSQFRRHGPSFVGRTDEEVARIVAAACCECGDQHPVVVEPAEWSMFELRSIDVLEQGLKDSLIRFRKLDKSKNYFLCGYCFYLLTED